MRNAFQPSVPRGFPSPPSKICTKKFSPSQWFFVFSTTGLPGGFLSKIHLLSTHPLDSSAHPAEAKEEAEEAADSLPSGTAGSCTGSGIRGGLLGGEVGWHEEGGLSAEQGLGLRKGDWRREKLGARRSSVKLGARC